MEIIWRIIACIASQPAVANWLIKRAQRTPYLHINQRGAENELYMGRWWLFNPYDNDTRKTKYRWCPISIRIHHICQPDRDPHLHDHPWNARTIILRGAYLEDRMSREHLRVPGDTARLMFGEYHRIAQISDGGVWTLFITGRYRGSWGFRVDGKKVPWREYLGLEG
jgi:hypothetical protein